MTVEAEKSPDMLSEGLKTGKANAVLLVWSKDRRRPLSQLKDGKQEQSFPHSAFSQLDESDQQRGRQSALLSLLTQMLISSKTSQINPESCLIKYLRPHGLVKLTDKIHPHRLSGRTHRYCSYNRYSRK